MPTLRAPRGLDTILSMRVAVISDLHLGNGDCTDGFGHEDDRFLMFLDHLEGNFEKVVLLGDIWETLTTRRPRDPVTGLREAKLAHPELAKRFERPCYAYVHGNHDHVAGELGLAPEELVIEAGSTRLLFTHGHLYDVICRRARWLSEMGVWFGGWLKRLSLEPLYKAFDAVDNFREGPKHDSSRCLFQRWSTHLARARNADVVVTGHTHVATRAEHGTQLFLNSGSCARGAFTWLSLDTTAGSYEVVRGW